MGVGHSSSEVPEEIHLKQLKGFDAWRYILVHQIHIRLYERESRGVNNKKSVHVDSSGDVSL